jgi:hypothetical protein
MIGNQRAREIPVWLEDILVMDLAIADRRGLLFYFIHPH